MSTTVDRRVVDMEFNNQRFERNVATTMSSLDKLNSKLSLKGAAKGLEEVNASANRINLSGLTTAAETVGVKFNAMWTIADQVFRNITNSAYYTGKRIISALTVDPVKTGLSEYETQINAVQTILANTESKGTTLGQVNAALDELNTYADKTIYNFTEMTRNIGTFTAAGVDLKTSVNAIQGIANLAAVSGSTSQQASTAMYQLSQALSSGTVKLMDWNSVVNAGMGGQVFQDALKETARVHGVNVDKMIEKHGSFRETLQEGWITSDILTETLSHFTMAAEEGSKQWELYKKSLMDTGYSETQAKAILKMANTATSAATEVKTATQLWDTLKETAQSGWTQTWELIMGDFGEAKELFSGIYNTISPMLEASAKARNELLSGGLSSGWKQLMGAGIADEEGYKDIFQTLVKEEGVAFDEMIKKEGSFEAALKKGLQNGLKLQQMADSVGIDELTNNALLKDPSLRDNLTLDPKLKSTSITTDMLSASVRRLADKMRNMSAEEREAAGYTEEHVEQIEALAAGLKDGSISMDEFRDKILRPSGRENIIAGLKNALEGVLGIMRPIKEAFRNIFPPATAEKLYSFTESFRNLTERFKLFSEAHGDQIRRTFQGIFAVIDIGWTFVKKLIGGIGDLLGNFKGLGGGVLDATARLGDWLTGVRDTVKETDIFGNAISKVVEFLGKVIDKLKQVWKWIKDTVAETDILAIALDKIRKFLAKIGEVLKKVRNWIRDAFQSPSLNTFFDILRAIWDFIVKIGSKIGQIFAPLGEAIVNLFANGHITDLIVDGGLLVVAARVVKTLKSIFDDFSEGGGLFGGIKDALDSVKGCLESWQNSLQADTIKKIAIAIAILAASIFVLSSIDGDALDRSLGAVGVMFAELIGAFAIFTKLNKNQKGLVKAASAMAILAAGVLILSFAMKVMASLSWEEIGKGLAGTAGGIAILVAAVNLLPEKKVNKAAKGIRKLAVAVVILAAGMKIMASMSWDELARGLVGTVGGLAALVAAVNLLPKDAAVRTLGMIGLTTSMVILGGALKIMASMSWEEIGKSLTAMGGALLAMTLAMKLMPKDAAVRSIGVLVLATSMVILGGAMKIFASMSWEEIAKGLAAMGGSLLILAAALKIMKGTIAASAALVVAAMALAILTPVMKTLGNMSWDEIIRSLVTLAGALAVLGVGALLLKPVVPVILKLGAAVALFGIGLVAAGAGILLVSAGLTALGVAFATFGTAIVAGISAIIMGIVNLIPAILRGVGELILGLCDVIAQCAPAIVETIFILLSEICTQLATYVPMIADALFSLLIGAIDVLAARCPELVQSVINLIVSFFSAITDAVKGLDTTALVETAIGFALVAGLAAVLSWVAGLIPGALVGALGIGVLIAEIALIIAAIGALGQIPGLKWLIDEGGDMLQSIGTALGKFVGGLIGGVGVGISAGLAEIGANLSAFMINVTPFILGCKMIDASMLEGVGVLTATIMALTVAELLNGITSFLTLGSSLADLGSDLSAFMINATPFITGAMLIKPNMLDGVRALADTILVLTAANVLDGLSSWISGGSSLGSFAEQLPMLGAGITEFAASLGTFSSEQLATIQCAAEAIRTLAQASSEIPNSGGLVGAIIGENDLSTFADQFPNLGTGIRNFLTNIGTFTEEEQATVTCAAGAIKILAEAAKEIPNEGGYWAKIAGDNSLETFASYFPSLGTGIRGFLTNIGTFTEEEQATIACAAEAIKVLSEAAKEIPNEGGLWAKIAGDNSLGTFADYFPKLATGIRGFVDNIGGTFSEEEQATIGSAAEAIKVLAGAAKEIPNEGGLWAKIAGDNSLETFASYFPSVGKGIRGFVDELGTFTDTELGTLIAGVQAVETLTSLSNKDFNIKKGKVDDFAEAIPGLGTAISKFAGSVKSVGIGSINLAVTSVNKLVKMVESLRDIGSDTASKFKEAIQQIAQVGVSGFVRKFTGEATKKLVIDAGKKLLSYAETGFAKGEENLKKAVEKVADAALAVLTNKDLKEAFKAAGKNLVTGFANGISENTFKAEAKAKAMAKAAVDAAEDELDIHSPSKVGYGIGNFFGVGFVNAIADSAKNAYSASSGMADSAKTGLKAAFDKVDRIISGEVDISPTISPVLDLTNIKSGANSINDMFSLTPSIDVLSHIGSVNALMNQRSQNGGADEIVSAIKGLRKDIGNMKTTTNYFGGISYSHGDEIDNAISTLVRYLKLEGRV